MPLGEVVRVIIQVADKQTIIGFPIDIRKFHK
jgi:hypothetical protein